METAIQKIYPSAEELSTVCSKIKCPQSDCKAIFQSTSNLNMHLIKHHKLPNNGLTKKETETQYFCPIASCPYHKDSKKYFLKLKYLKQHFLKVHALREFMCKKCSKKFSTESFRTLHMKNCGKVYSCTCGSQYTSSEAILTHCKRKGKGHTLVQKSDKDKKCTKSNLSEGNETNNTKKPERFIYPKLSSDISFPIHYIAAVALSELSAPWNFSKVVDKGMQTEIFGDFNFNKESKRSIVPLKCEKKRKNSQQTQTTSGKCKKLKISAQTQTNSDYLKHKAKGHLKTVLKKRKKSMETQTRDHTKVNDGAVPKIQPCDKETSELFTSANDVLMSEGIKTGKSQEKLNFAAVKQKDDVNLDEDKGRKWIWDNQFFARKEMTMSPPVRVPEVKNELFIMGNEVGLCNKELDLNEYNVSKNHSSQYGPEQGSDNQMFDINKLCNIETQTEIDTFLTECSEDTNFTLCSTTETQTTDDFDSLLYSNMCTQTCEEVDQLFNFNFVHIETQTAWPDLNDSHDLDS